METMREEELHADHEPHVLFQASTIAALIDGAYDGDLTFAELAEHGDLGLGTLNGLDGEMIALDGGFYRASVDGDDRGGGAGGADPVRRRHRVRADDRGRRSAGRYRTRACSPRSMRCCPTARSSCAIRLDGRFESLRARSVPRQHPPYRPLTEVVAEQHVFELDDVTGTMLGFRFPSYAEGIEVGGYHLHFIDSERRRGGHVLDSRIAEVRAGLDPSGDLHIELPPADRPRRPRPRRRDPRRDRAGRAELAQHGCQGSAKRS